MARISDEIRDVADGVDAASYRKLLSIADRIDRETVELPCDRDGVPIRVGDTVYLEDGRKGEVSRITLERERVSIDLWMPDKCRFFYSVAQGDMTHTVPDSLERIADDIEKSAGLFISEKTLDGWAYRIRKLAAKDD